MEEGVFCYGGGGVFVFGSSLFYGRVVGEEADAVRGRRCRAF